MEKKLYRNESDKVLGGVASGLADYLNLDVTVVRIGFLLLFFFGGSGLLIYVIMWIVVPVKKKYDPLATDYRVYDDRGYQKPVSEVYQTPRESSGNGRFWVGLFLVLLGLYFLFYEFNFIPYWISMEKLWPLIFIIPGIIILSNSGKKADPGEERDVIIRKDTKETTQDPDTSPSPGSSTNTTNTDQSTNETL